MEPMTINILPAKLDEDSSQLFLLNQVISPDETIDDFRMYFSAFKTVFLKACIGNEILGFVSLMYPFWNRVGIIHHLIVKPEYRNRGVGLQLISSIIAEAKKSDLRILTVQTADWNLQALSLYLRQGFHKSAMMKDYYGKNNSIAWLERDLQSTQKNELEIKQPTLESERLILSPLNKSFEKDIFEYAQNPEVARYVPWEPHKTLNDTRDFIASMLLRQSSAPGQLFFVWVIQDKKTEKAIGTIDFKQPAPHVGQIDYALGKDHWGKGIMSEAAQEVRKWAIEHLPNIKRLQAFAVVENVGSTKVMEKIGFHFEGIRKKQTHFKDEYRDLAYYAEIVD